MRFARNLAAALTVVVALAWVSTFAVAPSVLPDFLRPAHGWRELVPNFISTAGADNPGTPRVQGVPNGFPMPISALTNTSPPSYSNATTNPLSSDSAGNLRVTAGAPVDVTAGATAISAICTDGNINACTGSSTVPINLAGENAASFTWDNSTFTSTLQADCQLGSGVWQIASAFLTGAGGTPNPSGIAYVASSTTKNAASVICPQGSQAARLRANAAVTNSTSVSARATPGAGGFSIYGDGSNHLQTVVSSALPAGTNAIGTVQIGNTPNTTPILVSEQATTAGGCTIARTISAASTNAATAKASAGNFYGFYATNTNAAFRWVKLYNKASNPTVGTDTPVMTLGIPPGSGSAPVLCAGPGVSFSTGIATAITTGVADSDTGSVAANEVVVNLLFK